MKLTLVTDAAKWERLEKQLHKNTVCGFDTEAVGPRRRYSKANPKAFMNLALTSLQGASWAFEDESMFYLPLRHRGPNGDLGWLYEAVNIMFGYDAVWAHNVKFDSRMLDNEGLLPTNLPWRDSYLAAWMGLRRTNDLGLKALAEQLLDRKSPGWDGSLIDKTGAEVLEYACHDALNTLQVGQMCEASLDDRQLQWLREVDYPMAELLGRIERDGIPLNIDKLERTMGQRSGTNYDEAKAEWDKVAQDINPASTKDLQALFEDGTWKPNGATAKGAFKTGGDVLKYNVKQAPTKQGRRLAELALIIRETSKVQGTYVKGFREELLQWPDKRLHPELNQAGTRTTRFSSANPNIQNQLAHGEYAPLLRECFEAPPGYQYVAADYSQQEPRIFACLAGEGNLMNIFREGKDLHQEMANAIGGTRDEGKTFNMGFLLYGGSAFKASREFGWSKEEAQRKIDAAFRRFPESPALRDKVISVAERREPWPFVRIKSGHVRVVPELVPQKWAREQPEAYLAKATAMCKKYNVDINDTNRVSRMIRASGERIALNTIIQGGGAAMTKLAMMKFDQVSGCSVRIVTMTHDEITILAKTEVVESAADLLQECMVQAGKTLFPKVPFPVTPKIGNHWGELK